MEYHTHNLLKSRKAQFFVVSTVAIVSIFFILSKYMGPQTLVDTSSAVLNEPFIFDNVVEKASKTVEISENCEELYYNLDEYKNFVESFYGKQNIKIDLNYTYTCNGGMKVNFDIQLTSPKVTMRKLFVVIK